MISIECKTCKICMAISDPGIDGDCLDCHRSRKIRETVIPKAEIQRIVPYYIRLTSRKAANLAIKTLLDDGAGFYVEPSGEEGAATITVYESRALAILKQI